MNEYDYHCILTKIKSLKYEALESSNCLILDNITESVMRGTVRHNSEHASPIGSWECMSVRITWGCKLLVHNLCT